MKTTSSYSNIAALLAGLAGLFIPLFILPDSFGMDIQIAAGIFLLSAIYYIAQPVPIYATSLLVIFITVFTLTKDAPLQPSAELISPQQHVEEGVWQIPVSSLHNGNVYIEGEGKPTPVPVTIVEKKETTVLAEFHFPEGKTGDIYANAEFGQRRTTALTSRTVFATLASPIIILFLGGFMLARGAVKYNLDTNLTRILLKPFGTKPGMIIMGLMAITALLSAFMSNTATTAMMMTMIIPIISKVDIKDRFRVGTALSIPVAANIGGMATPIGTPPNAIVVANLSQQGINIGFSDWMLLATPVVLILLAISWVLLIFMFKPTIKQITLNVSSVFDTSAKALGLYIIFGITVLLWITENQHGISSSVVAFLPITFLSLTSILDKDDIRSLPWEVLWLVAGGIALGLVINQTGLATLLVGAIQWSLFSALLLIIALIFIGIVMSNFLSNTVTAALLVPIGISIGMSAGVEGYSYIIGAIAIGLGTSCAMLLPISTPPNAIAISTNLLDTSDMTRFGLIIGLVAVVVITLAATFYWPLFI